jgi:hypothetical protein
MKLYIYTYKSNYNVMYIHMNGRSYIVISLEGFKPTIVSSM